MKVKLEDWAFPPDRAHDTDAGIDLRTPKNVFIAPGGSRTINTGVHIQLPHGTVGMIKSKSGLNMKLGVLSEGVIDEGYTGSIVVKLYNHNKYPVEIDRGDKITQLVVMPVLYEKIELVDELEASERGDNGFGSTGR